jgi:hypothetical protein
VKCTSHAGAQPRDQSPAGEFTDDKAGISRHYSEAFCMGKPVYESLLKLAANPSDSDAAATIVAQIKKGYASDMCLTIKDYKKVEGLSNFIHRDIDENQHVFQF